MSNFIGKLFKENNTDGMLMDTIESILTEEDYRRLRLLMNKENVTVGNFDESVASSGNNIELQSIHK